METEETINFNYYAPGHNVSVSSTPDDEILTLDVIFEKFEMFLHSAGYDYVHIDRIGPEFGDDTSWVITKDIYLRA